jgi:ferredoxin
VLLASLKAAPGSIRPNLAGLPVVQDRLPDERIAALSLQILIDRDTCMGSGNCVFWAPGTFDLGDDGISVVLEPAEGEERQMFLAQEGCPTRAISLWRDGVEVTSP